MSPSSSLQGFVTLKSANPYRLMFARGFLRSLMDIRRRDSSFPSSARKRGQRIKLAAYSSMARAIGPRKAWTRALLSKLRTRKWPGFVVRRRSGVALKNKNTKKKRVSACAYKSEISRGNGGDCDDKTEKLREIVPGGRGMDICSLFEETAHFIECLAVQVQVMQDIADQLSK